MESILTGLSTDAKAPTDGSYAYPGVSAFVRAVRSGTIRDLDADGLFASKRFYVLIDSVLKHAWASTDQKQTLAAPTKTEMQSLPPGVSIAGAPNVTSISVPNPSAPPKSTAPDSKSDSKTAGGATTTTATATSTAAPATGSMGPPLLPLKRKAGAGKPPATAAAAATPLLSLYDAVHRLLQFSELDRADPFSLSPPSPKASADSPSPPTTPAAAKPPLSPVHGKSGNSGNGASPPSAASGAVLSSEDQAVQIKLKNAIARRQQMAGRAPEPPLNSNFVACRAVLGETNFIASLMQRMVSHTDRAETHHLRTLIHQLYAKFGAGSGVRSFVRTKLGEYFRGKSVAAGGDDAVAIRSFLEIMGAIISGFRTTTAPAAATPTPTTAGSGSGAAAGSGGGGSGGSGGGSNAAGTNKVLTKRSHIQTILVDGILPLHANNTCVDDAVPTLSLYHEPLVFWFVTHQSPIDYGCCSSRLRY